MRGLAVLAFLSMVVAGCLATDHPAWKWGEEPCHAPAGVTLPFEQKAMASGADNESWVVDPRSSGQRHLHLAIDLGRSPRSMVEHLEIGQLGILAVPDTQGEHRLWAQVVRASTDVGAEAPQALHLDAWVNQTLPLGAYRLAICYESVGPPIEPPTASIRQIDFSIP